MKNFKTHAGNYILYLDFFLHLINKIIFITGRVRHSVSGARHTAQQQTGIPPGGSSSYQEAVPLPVVPLPVGPVKYQFISLPSHLELQSNNMFFNL